MIEIEVCENCYSCNISVTNGEPTIVTCNDCEHVSDWSLIRFVEKECVDCGRDSDYRTAHQYDELLEV